jgi:hypothetical protein
MDHRRFSSLQHSFGITVSNTETQMAATSGSTRERNIPQFVEVVVGPNEEVKGWIAPKMDLMAIPYFRSLIESSILNDAKVLSFRLPDSDPVAFGQVIHFVRHGKMQYDLPSLCKHNNKENPDENIFFTRSEAVVKTYVLAEKLGMEDLANIACDAIRNSLSHLHLTSSEMRHIVENLDKNNPLYRLSMQALAVGIHKMGWSKWRLHCNWWFQGFVQDEPKYAQIIADALTKYKDCEYPRMGDGVCQWHAHKSTAACEPAPASEEVETETEIDVADHNEEFLWGNQDILVYSDEATMDACADSVETDATTVEESCSDAGSPKADK